VNVINLRPYRGTDEGVLLALWNATLTHDAITPATFRTKVLLDPNFDPDGLLVADDGNALSGFVLSLARRVPFYGQGLEPELGWITAFGVATERRRQGIGGALFTAALGRLAQLGRQRVLISPYAPNYFAPGIDVNAYGEALAFLCASGWQTVSEPISMRAELTGFRLPTQVGDLAESLAAEGIGVRPVSPTDLPELMRFIQGVFGWDWYRFAREYLAMLFGPGADDIVFLVATQRGRIIGYCQQRRERFGPFGVSPELRGKGIGTLLVARCLEMALAQGFHCVWFLWTGQDAARLYAKVGFRKVRRFAVMQRELR
jgi:mycothiol synthase